MPTFSIRLSKHQPVAYPLQKTWEVVDRNSKGSQRSLPSSPRYGQPESLSHRFLDLGQGCPRPVAMSQQSAFYIVMSCRILSLKEWNCTYAFGVWNTSVDAKVAGLHVAWRGARCGASLPETGIETGITAPAAPFVTGSAKTTGNVTLDFSPMLVGCLQHLL